MTEALVLLPADTTIVAEAFAMPLMATDCGEFAALSLMAKLEVRTPAACGEKTIITEQEALAASGLPQVLEVMEKSATFAPVRVGAELNVSVALPELVIVTGWGALVSPCVVAPEKFRVPGTRVTSGAGDGGGRAVPVNITLWGLPGALSAISSVALLVPVVAGAKLTKTWQEVPGESTGRAWQVSVSVKGAAMGLSAMELMVSASLPVLEMVTVCDALTCPGVMGPKVNDCVLREAPGAETAWPGSGRVAKIGWKFKAGV